MPKLKKPRKKPAPKLSASACSSIAKAYDAGRTLLGLAKKYRRSMNAIRLAVTRGGGKIRKQGRPPSRKNKAKAKKK